MQTIRSRRRPAARPSAASKRKPTSKIRKQTATGDDSKPAGDKPASDSKPADGLTPAVHTALLANNSAQAVIPAVALVTAAAAAPVAVPQAIAATALQAAVAATESAKGTPANLTAVKADVAEPATDSNASAKTTSVSKSDGKPQPATGDADKLVAAPSHDETPATGHHAATGEAPPAITADAQAAAPKTVADAVQQAALTAPPQDVTQTAANPVARRPACAAGLGSPARRCRHRDRRQGARRQEPLRDQARSARARPHRGASRRRPRRQCGDLALIADRSDTLDLLRRDANDLQHALQDAGLKTSDNGLQFSLRDQTMGRDQSNTPMRRRRADRRQGRHASGGRHQPAQLSPPRRSRRRHRHPSLRNDHDHDHPARHDDNANPQRRNAATVANAVDNTEIASNFTTFLQLLTTQLKNQDPLSPMDTNQFTQQLVEFAGVEQQMKTNTTLEYAGVAAAERANLAGAHAGRRHRGRERHHRAVGQRPGDLDAQRHASPRPPPSRSPRRPARPPLAAPFAVNSGAQPFTWNGRRQRRHARGRPAITR